MQITSDDVVPNDVSTTQLLHLRFSDPSRRGGRKGKSQWNSEFFVRLCPRNIRGHTHEFSSDGCLKMT